MQFDIILGVVVIFLLIASLSGTSHKESSDADSLKASARRNEKSLE